MSGGLGDAIRDGRAQAARELNDLAAWERKCRSVDLIELGDMLFRAPTRLHERIAAHIANQRLAEAERAIAAGGGPA